MESRGEFLELFFETGWGYLLLFFAAGAIVIAVAIKVLICIAGEPTTPETPKGVPFIVTKTILNTICILWGSVLGAITWGIGGLFVGISFHVVWSILVGADIGKLINRYTIPYGVVGSLLGLASLSAGISQIQLNWQKLLRILDEADDNDNEQSMSVSRTTFDLLGLVVGAILGAILYRSLSLDLHSLWLMAYTTASPIAGLLMGEIVCRIRTSPKSTKQHIPAIGLEPELIFLPGGRFPMGSDKKRDPDARDDELPQHEVYVGDFYIAKYPVTNAEYKRFLDATGHQMPDEFWRSGYPYDKANHPVVLVSWHDAVAYCKWLAEVTGKPYRLLSEAEWEKAARGTDGWIYPWGDEWDPKRCNAGEGGRNDTTRVGEYSPQGDSPYGCADMAGNVYEWTGSLWGEKSKEPDFKYPYDSTDGRENLGAEDKVLRVLRGGSWDFDRSLTRCAFRGRDYPDPRWHYPGFRIVVSPISP